MKLLVAVIMMLLPIAAPSQTITGVSGVLDHQATVTIYGSGFGTKTNVAPLLWDDVEGGSVNAEYEDITGLYPSPASSVPSVTADSAGRRYAGSSYGYYQNMYAGGDCVWTVSSIANDDQWFVSYWFKMGVDFDLPPIGLALANMSNVKIFRLMPTGSQNENFLLLGSRRYAADNMSYKVENVTSEGTRYLSAPYSGSHWDSTRWMDGRWHHAQFEFTEGDQGVSNGVFRMWIDGQQWVDVSNIETKEDFSNGKRPRIGWENSAGGGFTGNEDGVDPLYMDDIYVDNSIARVELGDASTYALCSHREVQIPITWSAGSVEVTVNAGTFSTGDAAWIFVVDSSGSVSNGGAVTIGADGGGVPPSGITSPPTNLTASGGY